MKKVYLFNITLWKSLFDQLGVDTTNVNMQESVRVISNIRRESAVRVEAIVELCNNYRLDIRQFFVEMGAEMSMAVSILPKSKFKPIVFNSALIATDNKRQPRHTDVLDALNTHGVEWEQIFVTQKYDAKDDGHGKWDMGGSAPAAAAESAPAPAGEESTSGEALSLSHDAVAGSSPLPYSFNAELFKILPRLLNVGRIHIGLRSGHAATLWQRVSETGNISVANLVDVCNAFRLNINEFFSSSYSEKVVMEEKDWQPIEFHNERLRGLFVGKDARMNLNELCAQTRFTRIRIERYIKSASAMQADDLITLCKVCGVAPSYFWDGAASVAEKTIVSDMRTDLSAAKNAEERMRKENAQLQAKIRHLEAMLKMKDS